MSTTAAETVASVQVRQHNAITNARYEMSACEMDIVFALLSKLSSNDKPGTMYLVRVRELEHLTGRQWNYKQLLDSTEQLNSRIYHIEDKAKVLQISLLASAEYLKGKGVIELEISEKMRPYLIDLKSNFTSYHLQAALSLTSKFAKRIYQLVSQWKDVGHTKTYTLDEFKYMLNLKDPKGKEPEQYVAIANFQRDVLKVAINQINEHTDLRVSYELLKSSRAYDRIKFYVNAQEPKQLLIPFELPADDAKAQMASKHLESLGIVEPKLVQEILQSPKHTEALFGFIYKLKTDKIKADKNPGGLFLKMQGLR
ncbi:replication initiation protein [Hymenobacter monticola]|jgi:plasmid replication initiation protein|uniref:Replication initiation protein n=1 Tax=Hymenobacter monticola TaxID=1705399 RepID=A0ABY4BG20_9BACT|nr:replication initiation protein [Hymenobacter monticola]UOE36703.1 replication initiation protein [Hymenobacter monticola]